MLSILGRIAGLMRRTPTFLTILLVSSAVIGLSVVTFKVHRVIAGGTIIAVMNSKTGSNEFTFSPTRINSTFIANVTVMNVLYLAGWQMNMTWDPTLLTINSTEDASIPADNIFGQYALPLGLTVTPSSMFWLAVILDAPINYVNVTYGTLCQIRFTILRNDTGGPLSCNLHLVMEGEHSNYTLLGNSDAEAIPYTPIDGKYKMLATPYHQSTLTLIVNENIPSKPYWNGRTPTNYTFTVHNKPDSRSEIVKIVISRDDVDDGYSPDKFHHPPGWITMYEPLLRQITFESTNPAEVGILPSQSANFTVCFTSFPEVEAKYRFTASTIDIHEDLDVHYLDSYLDTRAPFVTLVFPTEEGYTFGSKEDIWINATAQDNTASPHPSDIQEVYALIDGINYSMINDPITNVWFLLQLTIDNNATTPSFSEGEHPVAVYANDFAGNIGHSATYSFTVDRLPPEMPAWSVWITLAIMALVGALLLGYLARSKIANWIDRFRERKFAEEKI